MVVVVEEEEEGKEEEIACVNRLPLLRLNVKYCQNMFCVSFSSIARPLLLMVSASTYLILPFVPFQMLVMTSAIGDSLSCHGYVNSVATLGSIQWDSSQRLRIGMKRCRIHYFINECRF